MKGPPTIPDRVVWCTNASNDGGSGPNVAEYIETAMARVLASFVARSMRSFGPGYTARIAASGIPQATIVYPQDYKFSADPAPFTFKTVLDGRLIRRLVGVDTTTEGAETAGVKGKLLAWLQTNGPAAKTAMKGAGFGWETIAGALEGLMKDGKVDAGPGRTAKSPRYFVVGESSPPSQDGTGPGLLDES